MKVVRLELIKGLSRHVRAGHPWVFKNSLDRPPKIPSGSIVDLTENGRFVARGYYDPLSAIAVRVLTREEKQVIDAEFFRRRIAEAYLDRISLLDLGETDSFRLVHGEGDGLPGVVIDIYSGHAVLKLYSAGLNSFRHLLLEGLKASIPGLKAIIGRDEIGRDDFEADDVRGVGKVLFGSASEQISILERGVRFWVDPFRGQKTGFFLDQRENRFLIRRLSSGRRVLNCFSYTGGFSVNAALGGAEQVASVDSDGDAVDLARKNFELNGLSEKKHEFHTGDVFKYLAAAKESNRKFDLIVLDPPAFAKSQRTVEAAIAGYASLNRQALALLEPGGLLATASCSARITPEVFTAAVKEAAYKVGKELALVEEKYQPPDHPIRLQFPEGRYLKFLVLKLK